MAGYSGTPLLKKLGIKPGYSVLIINEPDHYLKMLGDFPEDAKHVDSTDGPVSSVEKTFVYDSNGNMTKNEIQNLESVDYDWRNLASQAITSYGTMQYAYDGNGSRIKKKVVGGVETHYVRGAYGETLAIYKDDVLEFHNILSGQEIIGTYDGTQRQYFLKDHLGSVRTTVDESGNVDGYDDYYPFGLSLRSDNSPIHNYKFTGHERDDEASLDLDYMNARNYDPMLGKFLQIDPAMEYASPYTYVGNNPLNLTDPTGMSSKGGYDWSGMYRRLNSSYTDRTNSKDEVSASYNRYKQWLEKMAIEKDDKQKGKDEFTITRGVIEINRSVIGFNYDSKKENGRLFLITNGKTYEYSITKEGFSLLNTLTGKVQMVDNIFDKSNAGTNITPIFDNTEGLIGSLMEDTYRSILGPSYNEIITAFNNANGEIYWKRFSNVVHGKKEYTLNIFRVYGSTMYYNNPVNFIIDFLNYAEK